MIFELYLIWAFVSSIYAAPASTTHTVTVTWTGVTGNAQTYWTYTTTYTGLVTDATSYVTGPTGNTIFTGVFPIPVTQETGAAAATTSPSTTTSPTSTTSSSSSATSASSSSGAVETGTKTVTIAVPANATNACLVPVPNNESASDFGLILNSTKFSDASELVLIQHDAPLNLSLGNGNSIPIGVTVTFHDAVNGSNGSTITHVKRSDLVKRFLEGGA